MRPELLNTRSLEDLLRSLRAGIRVSDTGGGEGARAHATLGEPGRRLDRCRAPARRLRNAARSASHARAPVRLQAHLPFLHFHK